MNYLLLLLIVGITTLAKNLIDTYIEVTEKHFILYEKSNHYRGIHNQRK